MPNLKYSTEILDKIIKVATQKIVILIYEKNPNAFLGEYVINNASYNLELLIAQRKFIAQNICSKEQLNDDNYNLFLSYTEDIKKLLAL